VRRASNHCSPRTAPTPVSDRTSISANFRGSYSLLRIVPSQPQKKPNGMEIRPGLLSGN